MPKVYTKQFSVLTTNKMSVNLKQRLLEIGMVSLPEITDELWEELKETDLMTWPRDKRCPHWTQTAVNFVAVLNKHKGV